MNVIVKEIIEKIKQANEDGLLSYDATNERTESILSEYGLDDDEDEIERNLGLDALHAIRDAEKGIY